MNSQKCSSRLEKMTMDSVSFQVYLLSDLAVLLIKPATAAMTKSKEFELKAPEEVEVTEVKVSAHSIYLRSLKIFLFLLTFAH